MKHNINFFNKIDNRLIDIIIAVFTKKSQNNNYDDFIDFIKVLESKVNNNLLEGLYLQFVDINSNIAEYFNIAHFTNEINISPELNKKIKIKAIYNNSTLLSPFANLSNNTLNEILTEPHIILITRLTNC